MRRRTKFGIFLGCVVIVLGILASIPATMPSRLVPILGLELGPETTIVTEPLNEFGFPDYLPVVNQIVGEGVKPEENFWAGFDEILDVEEGGQRYADELRKWPGFERTSTVPFVSSSRAFRKTPELLEELDRAGRVLWKPADAPLLVEWLTQNDEALGIVVDASARSKAYAPLVSVDPDRMLMGTLLPYAQQCRDVIRAITARSTLRMSAGHYDDAWQDVIATLRIARHNSRGFCFIERLVGSAIFEMGSKAATVALTNEPGSADVIRDRWKPAAEAIDSWPSMDHVSRGERCNLVQMHLMLLAGFDTDWGGGVDVGKKSTAFNVLWMRSKRRIDQLMIATFSDCNDALRYTNEFWDELDAALKQPTYSQQADAWRQIESDYLSDVRGATAQGQPAKTKLKTIAVTMLAPAAGKYIVAEAGTSQRRLLLHAAFVAEIHFRKTGREVESGEQLQQLAKQYAPEAGLACPELVDLFTGEPLRLTKVDGVLTIYAVGENGQDDTASSDGGDDVDIVLVREDELQPPPPPLAIEPTSDDDFDALLKGLDF